MMNMTLPVMQLSQKITEIPQALSIYINQIVYDQKRKGKDLTVLSLGEAFFDIPLFDFSKLDYVKGYHYSDSQGIPELRKKVSEFYLKTYQASVNPEAEMLISAGSKVIIFLAMQATLNAGDEVLIHEPAWLSYQEQAKLVNATLRFIPYDHPLDQLETYISPKTKMLILNNPNNPGGRIYTQEELEMLYEQCRANGIYLLVDEAYSDFLIDGPFYSAARLAENKDGVIVVNSLSKNMGMSGWRVGYVISSPPVIKAILTLNQHVMTCAPTILLQYMAKYFDEVTSVTLPQVRDVVEKRIRIGKYIDQLGLKRLPGESTFYFFVHIGEFPGSSLDFSLYLLLHHGVAVVPGSAYGDSTERFIRVAVGAESEERICEALDVIKDLVSVKTFDQQLVTDCLKRENIIRFGDVK